jgi:hypothetical protein
MKTPEAMKGRKLLIRLHEPGIERIRPDGLYMATAKVAKYYTSNKWVDLEYVVDGEEARLHLDRKFYRTDCTPVAFAQSKRLKQRGGVHCGWTIYREEAADIGEDVYELMRMANATP